ncbi:hypothetical protein JY97_00455 [Alkalispirochaeta odontotermitis]|nr:hypothetical protein JY97_00455 [Alkalispirochaeta odontotermitis]
MKAKNIKVGEYVFGKLSNMLVRVSNADVEINMRQNAMHFRRPCISDLRVGDIFTHDYSEEQFRVAVIYPTGWVEAVRVGQSWYVNDEPDKRVRIIRLADEKLKPRKVKRWHKIYDNGKVTSGAPTKEQAEKLAVSVGDSNWIVREMEWELPQ